MCFGRFNLAAVWLFFAVAVAAGPAAHAVDLPTYDENAYCQELVQHAGGSGELMADCLRLEETARTELVQRWPTLDAETQESCIDIALLGGRSYDMLKTCLDQMVE